MSQFIPLQEAIEMTTLYRNEKETILDPAYKGKNILARCETFERDVIDILLAKPGCAKLRIYYGMKENLTVHAILVAANEKDEDILNVSSGNIALTGDDTVENASRCPPECPPLSPLNP